MLKRLMTTWIVLLLLALPVMGSVYQATPRTGLKGCCAGKNGHCQATDSPAVADCPIQCTCAASEKPVSPGLLTNRPPLPNAPAAPVTAQVFISWPNAKPSNAAFRITTSLDSNSYLHHSCLRI
jgi:hypothetical protein